MILSLLLLAALATSAPAQTPDPDIYLAPLRLTGGKAELGALRNITSRAGYDNQPHFTRDGQAILYTARVDDAQTDIFRFDVRSAQTTRVTSTAESEYSATPLAGGGFAVIRVEADSSQRLWRFDDDGRNPSVLLANLKPVGYQAWIDEQQVALFVLGQPATLRVADVRTGRADSVAANIGRALQRIPGWPGVSFVQRASDSTVWLQRVHHPSRRVQPVTRLPAGGEYHAWTSGSSVLATAGSQVLEWSETGGGSWRVVADLAGQGLRLSRIAVSPRGDWVALVGERVSAR